MEKVISAISLVFAEFLVFGRDVLIITLFFQLEMVLKFQFSPKYDAQIHIISAQTVHSPAMDQIYWYFSKAAFQREERLQWRGFNELF